MQPLGIVTVWDLAHSAGALPVDLAGCSVDFAAGCTYKYINAGPGAPAFLYVAPRHANDARAALSGWMGHAKPFAFELGYAAAGLWNAAVTPYFLLSLPAVAVAILLGRAINQRMSGQRFLHFVYAGLLAIGTGLVVQAIY